MINLGDGPYNQERANEQIAELTAAQIPFQIESTEVVEVVDPESEAGQMARRGVYVPSLMRDAPKVKVVHLRVVGKLCGWEFRRAWYYWMAKCVDPSAQIRNPDAMQLWIDHGKELRVAGHCGCVKPEPPWLASRFEISEVGGQEDMPFLERLTNIYHDDTKLTTVPLKEVDRQIEIFKRDMTVEEANGGVESYHIDTQEALDAFAQYLLKRREV